MGFFSRAKEKVSRTREKFKEYQAGHEKRKEDAHDNRVVKLNRDLREAKLQSQLEQKRAQISKYKQKSGPMMGGLFSQPKQETKTIYKQAPTKTQPKTMVTKKVKKKEKSKAFDDLFKW